MNVPALSERTLHRDIEASGFTTGPEVQVITVDSAKYSHSDITIMIIRLLS